MLRPFRFLLLPRSSPSEHSSVFPLASCWDGDKGKNTNQKANFLLLLFMRLLFKLSWKWLLLSLQDLRSNAASGEREGERRSVVLGVFFSRGNFGGRLHSSGEKSRGSRTRKCHLRRSCHCSSGRCGCFIAVETRRRGGEGRVDLLCLVAVTSLPVFPAAVGQNHCKERCDRLEKNLPQLWLLLL